MVGVKGWWGQGYRGWGLGVVEVRSSGGQGGGGGDGGLRVVGVIGV